jgi:hypothetical protein
MDMTASKVASKVMLLVAFAASLVAAQSPIPDGPTVWVGKSHYHVRADCPDLVGITPETMTLHQAILSGRTDCTHCRALDTPDVKEYVLTYLHPINEEFTEIKAREAAAAIRPEVTEAQARDWAARLSASVKGDRAAFESAFESLARGVIPEYPGDGTNGVVEIYRTDAILISAVGQLTSFEAGAAEALGKRQSIGSALWPAGVTVSVTPTQADCPNIRQVVLRRNGTIVEPLSNFLSPIPMSTAGGTTRAVGRGPVRYPREAFDPLGDPVITITAIPETGANITRTLTPAEISRLW